MFKKLKQKIEEGGEAGIEKASFSPRKVPGSAIRSQPPEQTPKPEDLELEISPVQEGSGSDEARSVLSMNQLSTDLPSHLVSDPSAPHTYIQVLEMRTEQLERELRTLSSQLKDEQEAHLRESQNTQRSAENKLSQKFQEVADLERRAAKMDNEATELKLQIVELTMERVELQQQLEEVEKGHRGQLTSLGQESAQLRRELEAKITSLEKELNERQKLLFESEDRYSELKGKSKHLESTVAAFSISSDSEVIHRLQAEVSDLESRVQTRNLDIQILETRIARVTKEKEDGFETALDSQERLDETVKQLREELAGQRGEARELLKLYEKEQRAFNEAEQQAKDLLVKLSQQKWAHQQLELQLEQAKCSHDSYKREIEELVAEREAQITELALSLEREREKALEEMDGGDGGASLADRRELRVTVSTGVQTLSIFEETSAAVLSVNSADAMATRGVVFPTALQNGAVSATMQSLGPEEELQLLRREQVRLEEELAEKNKIIRLQQQKVVDMRKALNKELKSQSSVDGLSRVVGSNNQPRPPSPPPRLATDVNFQYLKHVVIKFICSKEDECLKLMRAIATLLEFSPQEETHVRQFLDYKMSWFGSVPPPLYPPMAAVKRT